MPIGRDLPETEDLRAVSPGAEVAHASGMMNFPIANPLIGIGAPLGSSVSFGEAGGMLMVVGVVLAVVILAVGVAPLFDRSRRRVAARRTRTRQAPVPSMEVRGAHQ